MMRLLKRDPFSNEKRSKAPGYGTGSGKTESLPLREGCVGLSSLGKCRVDLRKEENWVLVRRTALVRPPTQVANETWVSKPKLRGSLFFTASVFDRPGGGPKQAGAFPTEWYAGLETALRAADTCSEQETTGLSLATPKPDETTCALTGGELTPGASSKDLQELSTRTAPKPEEAMEAASGSRLASLTWTGRPWVSEDIWEAVWACSGPLGQSRTKQADGAEAGVGILLAHSPVSPGVWR